MATRSGRVVVPVAITVAAIAVVAAGFAAATATIARAVVTPTRKRKQDVTIRSVSTDLSSVTLSGNSDIRVPGKYSLWFANETGHARVGDILTEHGEFVTRAVEHIDFGDLARARSGRLSSWYYLSPEQLGLPSESVEIATDGGVAPAWLFPSRDNARRWAIHVHGRGTQRQESLRSIPAFHEAGYTNLVVSYRNDGDAPSSGDGRYGLGGTEWCDVDDALGYAVANGASEVVLVGWSMGGAIVLQTATRSDHAHLVRGVMLDSPVIDWVTTLEYQAGLMKLPPSLALGAMRIIDAPWGGRITGQSAPIGLAQFDFVARAGSLTVPMLLMHSDDDGYVPSDASHALAERRPDIVTFVPFTEARHCRLWNYDAQRWNAAIADWLAELA